MVASTLRRRSFVTWLSLTILVLAPEVALVTAAFDGRASCTLADAWVKDHLDNLPTDYDEFVSFPLLHRRAIFAKLSNAQRGELWATQLSRALVDKADLTEQHRRWILGLVLELRERGLPPPKSAEAERYARDVAMHAAGRGDIEKLFTQLGPDTGRYSMSIQSTWLNLQDAVKRSLVASAYVSCNCTTMSDWCEAWYSGPGYAWCEDPSWYSWCPDCETDTFCGTWWLYECNGMCSHCEENPPGSGEWFCGCS
jgi:hypothetical protein